MPFEVAVFLPRKHISEHRRRSGPYLNPATTYNLPSCPFTVSATYTLIPRLLSHRSRGILNC